MDKFYLAYTTMNFNSLEGIGSCTLNVFDFKIKSGEFKDQLWEYRNAGIIDEKALLALIDLLN